MITTAQISEKIVEPQNRKIFHDATRKLDKSRRKLPHTVVALLTDTSSLVNVKLMPTWAGTFVAANCVFTLILASTIMFIAFIYIWNLIGH